MNATDFKRSVALALTLLLALGTLSGCGSQGPAPSATPAPTQTPVADVAGATAITLAGTEATVDGPGATAEGGVVTVSKGGVYTVSGTLDDGRVVVNAKGEDVTLVLDGAHITCSYGSPIYIYKAKLATIQLQEGTENTLTDGENYTFADDLSSLADEEPNACLYSKSDLVVQGSGGLTVNANYKNGLTGKDTLVLRDAQITVNAVGHGVNGKDSNTLDNVTLTVTAGGDALRSTNDTDPTLGWVRITNSQVTLTAGDDAIHAEGDLTVDSGRVDILSSHEGMEGATVTVTGGEISVVADDDGINAGGSGDHAIHISGGSVTVVSGGDGLDSNGSMTVSGGAVTVFSTGRADGALDADGTLDITGGVVFAATGGSMPAAPRDPGQNTLSIGFGKTLDKGSQVTFQMGETTYSFTLAAQASSAVFSAPELTAGETCAVICDGETLAEVTVAQGLTTSGQTGGMGGFGGGMGGGRGQRPEGTLPDGAVPDDGQGQRPQGTPPDGAPDGATAPEGGRGQRPEGGGKAGRPEGAEGQPPEGFEGRGARGGGGQPPQDGQGGPDPAAT